MKFRFIGAGNVAQTYAKYFVQYGHEVVLSNSKGPDSIKELVKSIGPNAKAGTVQDAANQEIVILAVRWEHTKDALAEVSDWKGRHSRRCDKSPFGCGNQWEDWERNHRKLCSRSYRNQGT